MGLGNIRTALSYAHDARAWLKQARHAGTWVHTKAAKAPILSVVIPCHDAARWIATLVHSIQSQGIDELEILVVDDASTDASRAILNSLALLDKRIKVIDGEGHGPGAARNLAIQQAQGEFLTFADADDIVLPGAYSSMLDSLKTTGSDFVFGGYVRHKGSSVSSPQIVEATHREDLAKVTAKTFPQAFEEPVLWNKIFRTDFWNTCVGPIPEDVNYEDQPPVLRAICAATSFDVLKRDVYSWRLASAGTSRSTVKTSLRDVRDRAAITRMMWKEAKEGDAPRELLEFMLERIIARDLHMFAIHLPHKPHGDPYRETMRALARDITGWASDFPEVMKRIPLEHRLLFWVLAHGGDQDIDDEIGLRMELKHTYAFESNGVLAVGCHPTVEGLPEDYLRASVVDLPVHAIIQKVHWVGANSVELQVRAFMAGVNSDQVELSFFAVENGDEEHRVLLQRKKCWDSRNNAAVQDPWFDRNGDSFLLVVDLNNKKRVSIAVEARWNGLTSTTYVKHSGEPAIKQPGALRGGQRWTVSSERDAGGARFLLQLREIASITPVLTSWTTSNWRVHGETDVSELHYTMWPTGYRALLGRLKKIPLESNGVRVEYGVVSEQSLKSCASVKIRPDSNGIAYIDQKAVRVVLDSAEINGSRLVLTGRCSSESLRPSIWLRSSQQTLKAETTWEKGTFRACFDLPQVQATSYFLRWSIFSSNRIARASVEPGELDSNVYVEGTTRSVRIVPRENGTIAVYILPAHQVSKATRWETYHGIPTQEQALIDGVFFESFSGKNTADNPGAICEYLSGRNIGVPLWVSVRDEDTEVPAGAIPVITGSDAWYDKLTRAKVIVGNDNFPLWFRKRPGQHWLQTWHGWPIKRLLFDAHPNFVGLSYRRLMKRQASDWDLLLAQSDEAAQRIAGSAYYTGPVLEGEYPRNLALARAMQETASIKMKLGIAPGKRVILWAPTWRYLDEDLEFPADRIAKDNDAVVLVRGHHMKAVYKKGENVINVSSYPHVEELLAIADLLVSDYSSIFFDYALTGKTSIVYAPDLETYKTQERGFYSDWPNDSGRPVALTTKELESKITIVLRQTMQSKSDESAQQAAVQRSVLETLERIEAWIVQRLKS